MPARNRASIAALLVAVSLVDLAATRAFAAPPADGTAFRLASSTLASASQEAVRSGSVERYFVQLSDALGAALHGKPSKAVIAFAGTDVGTTAILHWRLLSRIGAEARADAACADVLAWLLADREALGVFLFSGDPAGGKWGEALRVLAKLAPDAEHRQGRAMRLAIATALVFAEPVKSMADGSAIDPVARVEHFLAWSEGGEFFPSFRELCAWEMRYVVGSWSSDDDLAWARANIKDELRARDKVGDAAYMVPYKDTNARGVSVQEGGKFYDDKPSTLAIMLEYGGVCGAISRFGSSMAQAFGVPAMPVGQPGHCAFIWQREPQRWDIGNDVSGWAGSGCHAGISIPWGAPAWFVPLMQDAQADRERFVDAEMLCAAAELRDARDGHGSGDGDAAIYAAACARCPLDYGAWLARVRQPATPQEMKQLLGDAATALARHPAAFASIFNAASVSPIPPRADGGSAADGKSERMTCAMAASMIAPMALNGADPALAAWALMMVLEQNARHMATPGGEAAVTALVRGERPVADARIDAETSERIAETALACADLLDVAPGGPAHDAWRLATQRAARGIVLHPTSRDRGLETLARVVATLVRKNRLDDARWIADRIVDAADESQDLALAKDAHALRKSLD